MAVFVSTALGTTCSADTNFAMPTKQGNKEPRETPV